MEIFKLNSITDFFTNNEALLLKNESFNNLMLGLAISLRDQKFIPQNPVFYSIQSNNDKIACALISDRNKPLMLSLMPNIAVELLIKNLIENNIEVSAVIGDELTTNYFKNHWILSNKHLNFKINTHLGVYECSQVVMPEQVSGKLILASNDHKKILKVFIRGFLKDFCPEDPENDDETIEAIMNHHLDLSCIYLLQNMDNELVSMAAIIRSTTNTDTVGFVYTPDHCRGKGYGSSIVALLSDRIIKEGRIANLFTDLTNSTTNTIYPKVGYRKIGQNIHYDFISHENCQQLKEK
jgi:predicted GNAT family acetyltransferase